MSRYSYSSGVSIFLFFTFYFLFFCTPFLIADNLNCESHGDYKRCDVEDMSDAVAFLEREYSKSTCIRGITWDVDEQGIWVDRGCSAAFVISRSKIYHLNEARARYFEGEISDGEKLKIDREREELERTRLRLEREKEELIARAEYRDVCTSDYFAGGCKDRQRK